MTTTLALTFDQLDAGITAGVPGRARTDIVSTGPAGTRAYEVQITISGVPDGATADIALLDEPPDSNPLLKQVDGLNWTLGFDKDCWGPFRVRCRATSSGVVLQSVARRISIRSPNAGLAYPANAERVDPNATSVASVQSVELTEMNEGGTNRPLVDFHRALVEKIEEVAAGGGAQLASLTAVNADSPITPGVIWMVDASTTAVTLTMVELAGVAPHLLRFGVKIVDGAGTHHCHVVTQGSDSIEIRGGAPLVSQDVDLGGLQGAYYEWFYDAAEHIWRQCAELTGTTGA